MRGIRRVDLAVVLCLVHLLDTAGVLRRHLLAGGSITNGGQVRSTARTVVLGGSAGLVGVLGLAVDGLGAGAAALAIFLGLPLSLFLLLAGLPFLADLLEFCLPRGKKDENVSEWR